MNIEPVSISAPLAFCADIILSVSSISVGMNLSAIVIIIASSCTGTFITFSGDKSLSIASVRSIGDVVYVRRLVPIIRQAILTTINTAVSTPLSVILMNFHSKYGVPVCTKNRLSIAVIIMIIIIGLMLFHIIFSGMRETMNVMNVKHTPTHKPLISSAINSITIKAIVSTIFTLASSLWTADFPGKYCPIVISVIN